MDPQQAQIIALTSRLTLLEWQLDTLMVVNVKLIESMQARSVHDINTFSRVMRQAMAEMEKAIDIGEKLKLVHS